MFAVLANVHRLTLAKIGINEENLGQCQAEYFIKICSNASANVGANVGASANASANVKPCL